MKYKIGDKVRVCQIVKGFANKKQYIGRTFTIRKINPNGHHCYNEPHYAMEEDCKYVFLESELVPFNFMMSDLRDGMIVEYHNGLRRLVLGKTLVGFGAFNHTDSYTNNGLSCSDDLDLRIDKVYLSKGSQMIEHLFEDENIKLIWERPEEVKEMTIPEIEKELGYKIKIKSEE